MIRDPGRLAEVGKASEVYTIVEHGAGQVSDTVVYPTLSP